MKSRTLSGMTLLAIMTVLVFPLQGQTERRPLRMMVRDILDLTPEQEARFDEMAKVRRTEHEDFLGRMEKMRGEFNVLVKDPNLDPSKADGLIDEMARLRAERQKAGLRQRSEMRKILTPEQRKKLGEYRDSFRDRGRDNRMRALGRRMGRFGGGFHGGGFRFHRRWW